MPEQALFYSPIAPLDLPADAAALQLEERTGLGKLILRGDASDDGFRSAVETALGTPPPPPGSAATHGPVSLLWQGPDSWLVIAELEETPHLATALRTAFAGIHAAATDVSSAFTVIRIAGPRARDLLYKGCFLDLDAPAFTAGQCAATRIAAFAVTVHQVGDEPIYDLYVARSMALAFSEWLLDAGGEFLPVQTSI